MAARASGRPEFEEQDPMPLIGTSGRRSLPAWYPQLAAGLTERVSVGRRRAISAVNQELIKTYWAIGRDLLIRQPDDSEGGEVIDRLAADLSRRFPEVRDFSARNLGYMRAFAVAWPSPAIVQRTAAYLPWRHHQLLLDQVADPPTRRWYAQEAIVNGWSRDTLRLRIEQRWHERTGRPVNHLATTLPPADSALVGQTTRDPYALDFVARPSP